ncbi:MAG: hypothetical protein CMN60_21125 [Sphingobium sp.]|nr:hypothetical protein [Sphingobium sp.]MBS50134.1 hypothetical protein [Sphingobium sp.]|tara:strand:+ start:203 stop:784 length:582 start_codon:yes stop_codon:yes gene_type:complete
MAVKHTIISRESMALVLSEKGTNYVSVYIGKALVNLYNRQTEDEKEAATTVEHNGRGFTSFDSFIGTQHAEYFLKYRTLTPGQVRYWTKEVSGAPRICRYARQLNEIAVNMYRRGKRTPNFGNKYAAWEDIEFLMHYDTHDVYYDKNKSLLYIHRGNQFQDERTEVKISELRPRERMRKLIDQLKLTEELGLE